MTYKRVPLSIDSATRKCIPISQPTVVSFFGGAFLAGTTVTATNATVSGVTVISKTQVNATITPTTVNSEIVVTITSGGRSATYTMQKSPYLSQAVAWANTTNVSFTGNSLTAKTAGGSSWTNAVPNSTRGIIGCSGGVSFVVNLPAGAYNQAMMVGLNADWTTAGDWTTLDHVFYITRNTAGVLSLNIYEGGNFRATVPGLTNGATLRIELVEGFILYFLGATQVYKSPVSDTPLRADISVFYQAPIGLTGFTLFGNIVS